MRANAATYDATFSFTGSVATCTTAAEGTYSISAYGAQGGDAGYAPFRRFTGGLSGTAGGHIFLTAGTTLQILVGGAGGFGIFGSGGGGGASNYYGYSNGNAGGSGSSGSGGGGTSNGIYSGAGGGGFYGDGGDAGYSNGGSAFVNGGAGGGGFYGDGGFGGGGGGDYGGGGGGGFTGGNGGDYDPGDGGTKFLASLATNTFSFSGRNTGSGFVAIERLPDPNPVPLPPAAALLIGGVISLGALKKRRKTKAA